MDASRLPARTKWEASILTEETGVLVEVELKVPSSTSMFGQLGRVTERHGMRMYRTGPLSPAAESERVSIAVPRAGTAREAEEIVAALLDLIRRWNARATGDNRRPGSSI
jgi:hypothetical protein